MRNFVITVNGKTYQVGVEEVGASAAPTPVVTTVQAAPVAAPVAAPAVAPANGEKVLSPFPGLIKNLLVAEGATVKKDQPILVLEAMKMENDIVAPCDGTIKQLLVSKGSTVNTDDVLVVM